MSKKFMEMFKKNLLFEIIVACLFSITICLFGPLEIILSQPIEFRFSVGEILPMTLGITLALTAVLLLIFWGVSLINEKVLRIVLSIVAAVVFCAYIQGNWTFVNYGTMDDTAIIWSDYTV